MNQIRTNADDQFLIDGSGCEIAKDRNRVRIGNCAELEIARETRNRRKNAGLGCAQFEGSTRLAAERHDFFIIVAAPKPRGKVLLLS